DELTGEDGTKAEEAEE
ncbi:hypothetical protein A2U01_0084245, partial [Trifolium medium]|nr:hypothetical protein [Trifolium medium]